MQQYPAASEALFNSFSRFIPVSAQEFEEDFATAIEVREFSKKEFILKQGEVDKYMNFVAEGIVRLFYEKDGQEYTTMISMENHFITSVNSFHFQIPSPVNIQALEPTVLFSISHDKLEKIYDKKHKYEKMGRLLLVHALAQRDKWLNQLARQSPRERFLDFIDSNPSILQRVPQIIIASYLQIKPETFSRFKHLIKNKR